MAPPLQMREGFAMVTRTGISHGLKTVHRTVLTSLRSAGLSIPTRIIMKKRPYQSRSAFFMVTRT
jgi:hypothetical protein